MDCCGHHITVLLTMALISMSCLVSGQQVRETSFSIGINKNYYPNDWRFYNEELPYYLILNGSKSWYSDSQRISIRKEAGLNLQYAPIGITSGGMGASSKYEGGIASLFASVSLQPRLRISEALDFSAGPVAEMLIIGYNKMDYEYYSMICDPPTFGNGKINGFNRDYFNQPSFGIKAMLLHSNPDAKTSLGLTLSYLWTNSESSNFYAESYARFSFAIGFKKQKEKASETANQ